MEDWGNITTYASLIKKNLSLAGWCCICQCSGEMVVYLLLHCDVVYVLWSAVFRVFGVHWVLLKMIAYLLFGWKNWFVMHSSHVWNMTDMFDVGSVGGRNSYNFQDIERPMD